MPNCLASAFSCSVILQLHLPLYADLNSAIFLPYLNFPSSPFSSIIFPISIPSCSISSNSISTDFLCNCTLLMSTPLAFNILTISSVCATILLVSSGIMPNCLASSFSCSVILQPPLPLYADLNVIIFLPYSNFPSSPFSSIIFPISIPSCSISLNNIGICLPSCTLLNCIFLKSTPLAFSILATSKVLLIDVLFKYSAIEFSISSNALIKSSCSSIILNCSNTLASYLLSPLASASLIILCISKRNSLK